MSPTATARAPMAPEKRARLIRIVTILVVLLCIGGFAMAVRHGKTGERTVLESGTPDIVEVLQPADGNHVLRQAQVGIDLATGWTGVLIINGIEIPEDQLMRRPELYAVYFMPAKGSEIEQLPAGRNTVTAEIWRVDSTRATSRSISWSFFVD